jgi:hypothetical protein
MTKEVKSKTKQIARRATYKSAAERRSETLTASSDLYDEFEVLLGEQRKACRDRLEAGHVDSYQAKNRFKYLDEMEQEVEKTTTRIWGEYRAKVDNMKQESAAKRDIIAASKLPPNVKSRKYDELDKKFEDKRKSLRFSTSKKEVRLLSTKVTLLNMMI